MREWLNKFGVFVLVGVLVVAVIGYFVMGKSAKAPSPRQTKAFYIDTATGEESVRPVTDVPPLVGKKGEPTVVQAIKYTCDGGKTTKIAYLLKYTPEAKAAMDRAYSTGERPNINMMANELVRSPEEGSAWCLAQSREGEALMGNLPSTEGKPEVVLAPQ